MLVKTNFKSLKPGDVFSYNWEGMDEPLEFGDPLFFRRYVKLTPTKILCLPLRYGQHVEDWSACPPCSLGKERNPKTLVYHRMEETCTAWEAWL